VAMAVALGGITQVASIGIALAKRTSVIGAGAWLAAAINVGLNLLLIPSYGAMGAAAATFTSYAVLGTVYGAFSQRLYPLPLNWKVLLYSFLIIASGLGAAFITFGAPLQPASFAVKIMLLALAVFGALPLRLIS